MYRMLLGAVNFHGTFMSLGTWVWSAYYDTLFYTFIAILIYYAAFFKPKNCLMRAFRSTKSYSVIESSNNNPKKILYNDQLDFLKVGYLSKFYTRDQKFNAS